MSKVRLTITESRCRCGYVKSGDIFIVEYIRKMGNGRGTKYAAD